MTHLLRTSSATWAGGVGSGSGRIGIGRTDIELPFSLATRIGSAPSTNPEELLASALAGCYSMSLAGELDGKGHAAESITATATVHLVGGDAGYSIPMAELNVVASVPGMSDSEFQEAAQAAHEGCPVSRLFTADVTLRAILESRP